MTQEIDYGAIILENSDQIDRICEDLEKARTIDSLTSQEFDGSLVILTAAVLRIFNILPAIVGAENPVLVSTKGAAAGTTGKVLFDKTNLIHDFSSWLAEHFSFVYDRFFNIIDSADHGKSQVDWENFQTLKTHNKTILDVMQSGRIGLKEIIIDHDNKHN